jgi:hypothetical protein
MADSDGHDEAGFKGEWMAIKDGSLYCGNLIAPIAIASLPI